MPNAGTTSAGGVIWLQPLLKALPPSTCPCFLPVLKGCHTLHCPGHERQPVGTDVKATQVRGSSSQAFFCYFLVESLKRCLCLGYPSAHKSHALLPHLKRRKRADRKVQKLFIFPAFCSEGNCVLLKWGGASATCSVPCWCTFPGEIPIKVGFQ